MENYSTCQKCGKIVLIGMTICPVCRIKQEKEAKRMNEEKENKK